MTEVVVIWLFGGLAIAWCTCGVVTLVVVAREKLLGNLTKDLRLCFLDMRVYRSGDIAWLPFLVLLNLLVLVTIPFAFFIEWVFFPALAILGGPISLLATVSTISEYRLEQSSKENSDEQ